MARFRRFTTVSRYIGREYVFSFAVAFLFFFVIFFINQILLLAEDILAKHVPIQDVALLIFYSLPSIISIAFPFASLVGALMAVGRLSSDNEILALKASGVSNHHIFLPLFLFGLVFTVISFFMSDYFLPAGTINFWKLYRKILYVHPELELESFSAKKYQDSIIVSGEVEGREIHQIIIFDRAEQGDRRIIVASHARLEENATSRGVVSLSLSDVFMHSVKGKRPGNFEYSFSDAMIYNILLKDLTVSLPGITPREMRSKDIYADIKKKEKELQEKKLTRDREIEKKRLELLALYRAAPSVSDEKESAALQERIDRILQDIKTLSEKRIQDRSLELYRMELYKKFSIPAGCISFVVLAFPLGLMARKSGRSVGFGIGLIVSILYWGLLFVGQMLGSRLFIPPFFAMWLPNLLTLAAGILLYAVRRGR